MAFGIHFSLCSRDEHKTLTKSMTDECDPCDDEVLEVLSSYHCKSRVSKENREKIIEQLVTKKSYNNQNMLPVLSALKNLITYLV